VNDPGGLPATGICETVDTAACDGDVESIRAMAATFRRTALCARREAVFARQALVELDSAWKGGAATTCAVAPWSSLVAQTDRAGDGLDELARALDRYAEELEDAQRRQRWSWQRIAAVGLTVTVIAGAVVVTGGAAVVTAAAAAQAATAIATASAAAATAGVAAAASAAAFAGLSALAAALPGLAVYAAGQGVIAGGTDVLLQQLAGEDVAFDDAAKSAAVGSATAVVTVGVLSSYVRIAPKIANAPRVVLAATPHVLEAGVDAGGDAALQQLKTGRIDLGKSAEAGLRSLLWAGASNTYKNGRVTTWSKPVSVRSSGVDLRTHEGRGHTIAKHVGKTPSFLRRRLDAERLAHVSSFDNLDAANGAVSRVLAANAARVAEWTASSGRKLKLPPYDVGHAVGTVIPRGKMAGRSSTVTVSLSKDPEGRVFVLTAYLTP
jgi:hypothetical protein